MSDGTGDDDSDSDSDTIPACPECDSSNLHQRQPDLKAPDREQWMCYGCRATFDDANWRERRSTAMPRCDSLARELLDADPDEVAADD